MEAMSSLHTVMTGKSLFGLPVFWIQIPIQLVYKYVYKVASIQVIN